MRFNDLFRDEDTITGGVRVHCLRILAVTAFGEEPLLILFSDADTRISHREDNLSILLLGETATEPEGV